MQYKVMLAVKGYSHNEVLTIMRSYLCIQTYILSAIMAQGNLELE